MQDFIFIWGEKRWGDARFCPQVPAEYVDEIEINLNQI